jgi:hypothetical protein
MKYILTALIAIILYVVQFDLDNQVKNKYDESKKNDLTAKNITVNIR